MTKHTLIQNAVNLGKETHVVAFAATLVGIPAESVCCWCAEHLEGDFQRLPKGGECARCPQTGQDVGVLFSN